MRYQLHFHFYPFYFYNNQDLLKADFRILQKSRYLQLRFSAIFQLFLMVICLVNSVLYLLHVCNLMHLYRNNRLSGN